MTIQMQHFPTSINLQLHSEQIDSVAGLDSLLGGNTSDVGPEPTNTEPTEPEGGGDPANLDSSKEAEETQTPTDDGKQQEQQQQQQQPNHNAAMAKMRIENTQLTRTLQELAKALNIQESDPSKLGDALLGMAQEKLAKDANVPVELYKELNNTKEQLAAVQYQQNQHTAKQKFMEVKELYGLDDKQLLAFAQQLDNEGVNAITNPQVDLEYEYYKRNREAIEKKRIAAAVEEAMRNAQAAEQHSTTPSSNQGAASDVDNDKKINNVSALNDLLAGK